MLEGLVSIEHASTLFSAWMFFLVMNARDLKILAKQTDQRTRTEQREVNRGLSRELLLETFVLVPASAALLILVTPLFISTVDVFATLASGTLRERIAVHAIIGIMSYGFPFVPLRERISRAVQAGFGPSELARSSTAIAVEEGSRDEK